MKKQKELPRKTANPKVLPSAEALIELHRFREVLYLFLSRSFSREADASLLRNARSVLKAVGHLKEAPLASGIQMLEGFFQENKRTEEEKILQDLAGQYASLFLGVGPETISLCESAYRHELGLLFQGSYFEVSEEYGKAGLTKRKDFTEPEDHLALELAFMADLSKRSRTLVEKGEGEEAKLSYLIQKAFLEHHIHPWVIRFAEGLSKISSGFYGAMAQLLRGFIEVDRNWINELLSGAGHDGEHSARKAKRKGKKEVEKQTSKKGDV